MLIIDTVRLPIYETNNDVNPLWQTRHIVLCFKFSIVILIFPKQIHLKEDKTIDLLLLNPTPLRGVVFYGGGIIVYEHTSHPSNIKTYKITCNLEITHFS